MSRGSAILPPDVAAYLVAAAKEVALEQKFVPASEDELKPWMEKNRRVIGERALRNMRRLHDLLLDDRIRENAVGVLTAQVYRQCRKQRRDPEWNPRYVAYAAAHGKSPDQMFEHDGRKMTNFLVWRGDAEIAVDRSDESGTTSYRV